MEEATKKLEAEGFVVGEEHQERNHEEIEKGKIIETDPAKNALRAKGTEIDLIVSLGVEMTTVDNYVGQNYSQVEALIKGKYKEVLKEDVPSNEPEGRIIEQSIPPNTEVVAKEETITFKVSQGVRMIRLENLNNYTKADMDDYVRRVGLNWRISREEYHESIPAGSVISQLTKAGTMVEEGSFISVVISKGPAKKPDKPLVIPVVIEYKPTEEGIAQNIRIEIQDKNHTFSEPVEFPILDDTPYNIQLVIEEGKDASYRIIRDSEIILEDKVKYEDVN